MLMTYFKVTSWIFGALLLCPLLANAQAPPPYLNTDLSFEQRVEDLVERMTLAEKISQLSHLAPGIDRLSVDAYEPTFNNPYRDGQNMFVPANLRDEFAEHKPWRTPEAWDKVEGGNSCLDEGYWGEALHGLARSGLATVFPQAIGMASTWNPALIKEVTTAISDEARVHNKVYGKKLTFWSPTINMLRDPRWGRTEEAYSEDPYLQSRMAVAFVQGLQGDHPRYLKAIATPKHFVANNSEFNRHYGNSVVSDRQLREYYFPAYKAAIQEGGAFSLMAAYNAVNGTPVSANRYLLTDVLRNEWGFKGYVVSDCGAISDIPHKHKYETDREKAVAMAVKAGMEIECETCETEQFLYDRYLPGAVAKGYITEEEIDVAVKRVFLARFRLGEFDPADMNPYNEVDIAKLDCQEHRDLALRTAHQSMVLLKNDNKLLPLDPAKVGKVAVIGPYADAVEFGAYSGTPSHVITPVEAIRGKLGFDRTLFQEGSEPTRSLPGSTERAVRAAAEADVAIVVLGTNQQIASEHQDRDDLAVPPAQQALLEKIRAVNPNTVLVLMSGIPLAVNWAEENVPAIVEAWFPGQAGGQAIADVIFGDVNPAGRLPVTFYRGVEDLPALDDYDIEKGRTYWYYEGDVLYPFGYGLSYTSFNYANLQAGKSVNFGKKDSYRLSFDLTNSGARDGDEVVQVYIRDVKSPLPQPRRKLREFRRVSLKAGKKSTVSFDLNQEDFSFWNTEKGAWDVEKGEFEIMIGSSSEDIRLKKTIRVK